MNHSSFFEERICVFNYLEGGSEVLDGKVESNMVEEGGRGRSRGRRGGGGGIGEEGGFLLEGGKGGEVSLFVEVPDEVSGQNRVCFEFFFVHSNSDDTKKS